MSDSRIWLSSPHMGESELKFIQEAFDSNWIAPVGANISGFENDLELFLGNNSHVAALNSGTSAIHLGLILLGVTFGDEVICQSFTFSASANPILYQGATPIFVDSEPTTWNLCPIALEEAILDRISKGKKPKAIIAVHLYGMPFDVEAITKISQKYDILILEDAAEALGSEYKNQKCGTFGNYAAISFNGNKIITTSAGGVLVCKSSEKKTKAIFLATQSRDKAAHYQHSEIGYNYRMSNICAGIGRGQMQVLENRIESRRKNNQFYVDFFENIDGASVLQESNSDYFSNHWLTVIQIDPNKTNGKTNEDLRLFLETKNIESRPVWKPLHLQPIFSEFPYYGKNFCEQLFDNSLCLPSGSNLSLNDKNRIIENLVLFFNSKD
jgi:dTDP-4-amino-4,6-dideoxygalactose transaminase